ncbi:AAA family ATPase [Shigella sp. FC1967]|uniref:AAA family ATPase n=1 Tax=Shigella sp. FC1967 TaxID=1898041 RepID=UPI00257120A6|nr:ATP-binding protein [Shigella sp. FC1967]
MKKGDLVKFDLSEESDGTTRLFGFLGPWIDSLNAGNILFIDELHNSLHPKMVEYLVKLFNNPSTNPNNAQLIFTTHETSILKQNVFRRDQIWFSEKLNNETSIYPLTDFVVRKGSEDLEASYLAGKFGALPFIGDDDV